MKIVLGIILEILHQISLFINSSTEASVPLQFTTTTKDMESRRGPLDYTNEDPLL